VSDDATPCEDELGAALRAFQQRGEPEPGLDVEDDALVQLRKACRILDGIRALRDIDRHHTIVIEGSFAALERTVQFYLVESGAASPGEFQDHEKVFERGIQAGLYARSVGEDLVRLWNENRSETYYRASPATAEQATTMVELAECLHAHAPQLAGRAHDCLCD
jgi:hypothetical protein